MTNRAIFIGYDPREVAAYKVAEASIRRRTTEPIEIRRVGLREMASIVDRPTEQRDGKLWCPISQAPMATEFAISRFCIPFLHGRGWALFMDCDVVVLADVMELFALADPRYAIMVVKHKQETGPLTKMDGQAQTFYARKNWSSVMLWNCSHPANMGLTRHVLNTWPGRDLHAFKWLQDDQIGELPPEWNYLVGVEKMHPEQVKIAHFTLGGPWFNGWRGGPMDDVWHAERSVQLVA